MALETAIDWSLVGLAAVFAVLVAAGAVAVRWARRQLTPEDESAEDELERYRTMVDDGLLDPDEFARIRARLEGEPDSAFRPGPPPDDARAVRDPGRPAGPGPAA